MSHKYVLLKEVCEKASSNIAQKDLAECDGIYPIYGASGYIKSVDFFQQAKDYIAIVKDGAGIGRAMKLPAKSSVIGTMQYVLPKDNINISYLYYAICSMHLEKYFSGATIPHIYFRDYQNEQLPLPTLEEQAKIANVFGRIDYFIKKEKEQLINLDKLVKSRFIEMFGTFPDNPKGWECCTIRDIVKEVRYGSSRPAVEGGQYPYLRMNNITYEGTLDLSEIKYIDVPEKELEKCTVRKGDVLFNRTNSKELVGKTCLYDRDESMVLAGFIIRVRVNDKVVPEFLVAFLNMDFSKKMLFNKCKAAIGQANINAQELQNIEIYLPHLALQKEFVSLKYQVDKSKFVVTAKFQ